MLASTKPLLRNAVFGMEDSYQWTWAAAAGATQAEQRTRTNKQNEQIGVYGRRD